MNIGLIALCLSAYLLGSVNSATIVSSSRGVDIRAEGSGNPGASNVFRVLGKGAAAVVYLLDLAKGFVPTLIALLIWDAALATAVGLCAVAGHCYPIFHRFRGGKGVATGGGVLLAVAPLALLALGALYGLIVWLTKISSVGSLTAVAATVPAAALAGLRGWALIWMAVIIALIVVRHAPNISRLIRGSEHRVVR